MTIFESLNEKELFTLAIYGEARGEPIEGKVAVASVIVNRLKRNGWFGSTLKEVILKPKQFSCFNATDENRPLLMAIARDFKEYLAKYEVLRECFWVAVGFLDGWLRSNVGDADHYHSLNVDPGWDDEMKLVATIGNHKFYEEA